MIWGKTIWRRPNVSNWSVRALARSAAPWISRKRWCRSAALSGSRCASTSAEPRTGLHLLGHAQLLFQFFLLRDVTAHRGYVGQVALCIEYAEAARIKRDS